ncbi:Ribonuclease P/MRP protein subunit POP5 [Araneus ventricosus]|uniref:Ribonuclease P/MRP protein subunit POP5 n=1 Tax=Araneus ventricosus TaxID=182803 RepID=A0A4Y2FI02_ARAVE|nr:Ribonuclease P/MRP protein subunit POP5 [Araneus ventricosus]
MVRVKYRYILAEIVTDGYQNVLRLPLREQELKQAILDSVQELHGDFGLASIHAGFSIKMYNAVTRIFILRVRRQYHPILSTSLVMMTSIGKIRLEIRTLHLSGTIRSAYKFLLTYDKQKIQQLIRKHNLHADAIQELSTVIENSHHRFAKKKFDAT